MIDVNLVHTKYEKDSLLFEKMRIQSMVDDYNFFYKSNYRIDSSKSFLESFQILKDLMLENGDFSNFIKLAFNLYRCEYNFYKDIIDFIIEYSGFVRIDENKNLFKKYMNSSVIDDISLNGGIVSISTPLFPNGLSYQLATDFYRDNRNVLGYIESKKRIRALMNYCYDCSYDLLNMDTRIHIIASLCTNYFDGKYYHMFNYDGSNNQVIDISRNTVMDYDDFMDLYQASQIYDMSYREFEESLSEITPFVADSSAYYDGCPPTLRLACYIQSQRENF